MKLMFSTAKCKVMNMCTCIYKHVWESWNNQLSRMHIYSCWEMHEVLPNHKATWKGCMSSVWVHLEGWLDESLPTCLLFSSACCTTGHMDPFLTWWEHVWRNHQQPSRKGKIAAMAYFYLLNWSRKAMVVCYHKSLIFSLQSCQNDWNWWREGPGSCWARKAA